MQDQPYLVRDRRTATGAVRRQLALVPLNQVYGLTTRTISAVVQRLWTAMTDVGDDVTGIEALEGPLGTRQHAAWAPDWCCRMPMSTR